MKDKIIRKHFRTDSITINYIVADLNHNINKNDYLDKCVAQRIAKLNKEYDNKLDKIITFMILKCNFDNLPITLIGKLSSSLAKVVSILNKGFLSIMEDK